MKFFKEWFSGMSRSTKFALLFVFSAVVLFCMGFYCGVGSNINATINDPGLYKRIQNAVAPAPTEAPTAAPQDVTQEEPSQEEPTEAPTESENPTEATTDKANEEKPTQGNKDQNKAPKTTAEIVAYYNKSANKVKTNAKKVTRNWEDLHSDDEYLEVPSALQTIAKTLMNTFLKKDETPLVWSTKEDIIANYPVKGKTFVSNAKESDISKATCTDDGKYYNITLKFKNCTDPQGTGCDAAFNIMRAEDVYEAASVVQSFSVDYRDAVIECKIDKATGNLVWAKYTLPMIMHVTAKVIMTLDAQVGMTFVDDYSITY